MTNDMALDENGEFSEISFEIDQLYDFWLSSNV